MKSKILFKSEGGEFVAVYSDELKATLPNSWDLDISRISDVEYNRQTDTWEATRKDGVLLAKDKKRNACVQKEIEELNKNLHELT